jgi:hypothetical protein
MGHVTDPSLLGRNRRRLFHATTKCAAVTCCDKWPSVVHPNVWQLFRTLIWHQQLKFCVQMFLDGPFTWAEFQVRFPSDQWDHFLVKCGHIQRHCGTLLAKPEYCQARTSEFYAAHEEIKTQHFSWMACLSNVDPHLMILLQLITRTRVGFMIGAGIFDLATMSRLILGPDQYLLGVK